MMFYSIRVGRLRSRKYRSFSPEKRNQNWQLYDSAYFDRRLLIADDLPGVSLTGFLQSNPKPGHLDLVLKSSKEPAYIADLAADNAILALWALKVSFREF